MEWQRFAAVHQQMFALIESNFMPAQQIDAIGAADALQFGIDGFGVNQIRRIAFEPEQYCLVSAVTFPGGAERTVQFRFHARRFFQQTLVGQHSHELQCRAHRSDRMRTRWSDADLE